jgi:polysaccharide biosynthesis protein PelG
LAGIGFKLRAVSQSDGLFGQVRGYVGAAVICVGPWLLTCMSLLLAGLLDRSGEREFFRAAVTYIYAFSLLYVGPFQNPITRYLSDRLHENDASWHLPSLVAASLLLAPGAAVVGWALFHDKAVQPLTLLLLVSLFVLVSQLWISTIYLGAVRAYAWIVKSFGAGALVSAGSMLVFPGAPLMCFWAGHALTLGMLWLLLLREFSMERPPDWGFLRHAWRYPALTLSGFLLNLCPWVGVFVYWSGPEARSVSGLWLYPAHDVGTFLAMLTVIPAITAFFVYTETDFFTWYRAYFGSILEQKPRLGQLLHRKSAMQRVLWLGANSISQVQALCTLLCAVYVPEVLLLLHLPAEWGGPLRWCLAGCYLLTFVQFAVMILYYFERYREACWVCATLVAVHAFVAWRTLSLSPAWHGSGLVVGGLCALPLAWVLLRRHLRLLEYRTFMLQPMPGTLHDVPPDEVFVKTVRRDGRWLVDV